MGTGDDTKLVDAGFLASTQMERLPHTTPNFGCLFVPQPNTRVIRALFDAMRFG